MKLEEWDALPWTPRGRIVKTIIEYIVILGLVLVGSIT
jgi:hypothetical protein